MALDGRAPGVKMNRDNQFDNMKAFLIYCVVLGHVLDKFAEFWGWHFLYDVIFTFHMPAFLFVSGYFARYQPKKFFARMFPLYVIFRQRSISCDVFWSLSRRARRISSGLIFSRHSGRCGICWR